MRRVTAVCSTKNEALLHIGEEWQRKRSQLNHDQVQNQFLNSLGGFLGRLQSHSPNLSRLNEFLEGDFAGWNEIRNGVVRLLGDLPEALSPLGLVDSALFHRLPPDTRSLLAEIV